MINRVDKFLDDYIKAGSNIITFHYEINGDLNKLIDKIKKNKIKVGIALKPKTPYEEIKKYLHLVDQIIIMTVEPGFGGQTFLSDQVNKIESVSKYIRENNLNVDIEVDGGLGPSTIDTAAQAGANWIVAGSSVFKSENPEVVITELREAVQKYI